VLVPREPTEAMYEAAFKRGSPENGGWEVSYKNIYQAMIAAAPTTSRSGVEFAFQCALQEANAANAELVTALWEISENHLLLDAAGLERIASAVLAKVKP
jgi:hypothetical protein